MERARETNRSRVDRVEEADELGEQKRPIPRSVCIDDGDGQMIRLESEHKVGGREIDASERMGSVVSDVDA